MGGIMEVAGIPGFLANLDDFYSESDAEDAAVGRFIGVWWHRYHGAVARAAELWDLVHDDAIGLELGAGSDHSRKTRLGQILSSLQDRVFTLHIPGEEGATEVQVQRAGTYQRAMRWRLRRVDGSGQEAVAMIA